MPKSRKRQRRGGSASGKLTADAILQSQVEKFRAKFGRAPKPGEPLFFDPAKDTPTPLDAKPAILKAMEKADFPPQIRFAYERTGLLLSSDHLDDVPPENLAAWEDAIDLYFAIEGNKGRADLPPESQWRTEVADLLVTFTNRDLEIVRHFLKSMAEFERSTPMGVAARTEIAAAYMANALDSAYEAAEATVGQGTGPDAFDRAMRAMMRRALEIYGQRGSS